MHAVLFQFRPRPEHRGTYFALVAELRPELQRVEGFLANERFADPADPGLLVSLSLWRDEAAIRRWREHAHHRRAQARGKAEVFAWYRLRVGEAVEEDAAAAGAASLLPLAVGRALRPGRGAELYRSLAGDDRALVLGGAEAEPGGGIERRLFLRVARDYGPGAAVGRR